MNRRNSLFASHNEGGRNWARFARLIGTCKMNGVEPYTYLRDLFISILSYEKPGFLVIGSHCPPRHLWRAVATVGSQ